MQQPAPPTTDPHPHRRIWRIAGPAIIANISGPMVGVVDTWALGHLPEPRMLAAIAVGTFVFHFVYWSFGFLRMGTVGPVAQAFGAGQADRLIRIVLRASLLGLGFSLLVLLLQKPLLHGLFAILNPNEAEATLAMRYCLIRIWAAPAILLRITIIGFLIGTQRVRTALVIELVLNIANALMTVALVTGLGWGIEGAAIASLAAEILAVVVAVFAATRLLERRKILSVLQDRIFWRLRGFADLMAVNAHLFLRTLFLLGAFALIWRTSAGLGTMTLSANQILMQFLMIASFGLDGMAYAAEALVGQAKGRKNGADLHRIVVLTSAWSGVLAVLYMLVYWLAGEAIIAIFTDHESVRAAASAYLPWLIFMPVVAVWSYQFDGIFIGATETSSMLWTMIIAFAIYALLLAVLVPGYGNHGLWGAMTVFLAVRGLGLLILYPRLRARAEN